MKNVYLDNAATTQMDAEVIAVMQKSMAENFGNPSSTHQTGRKAKSAVESARKNIAKYFNVAPNEIVFTSGGTEADNFILYNAVNYLGVERIITSKIEHHAVLNTCLSLAANFNVTLEFVELDENGAVELEYLEDLLQHSSKKTLVSLMLINNEIGNFLQVDKISALCKTYEALFHSDSVQAIGHYNLDLKKLGIDFLVASAHKFHGPKGVGFAIVNKTHQLKSLLNGGEQERGLRSGTENVHAILGMEKALELAYSNLEDDGKKITELKIYLINELLKVNDKITFNGLSNTFDRSSYTILNVRFPVSNKMLLFQLDMAGIQASAGSACMSGSDKGSHVLEEILTEDNIQKTSIRFSFSKFTTKEDIDYTVQKIKELL